MSSTFRDPVGRFPPRRGSVAHALLELLLIGCHLEFCSYDRGEEYLHRFEGSGGIFVLRVLGWPVRVYAQEVEGSLVHQYWMAGECVPAEAQYRDIPIIVIGQRTVSTWS